MEFKHSLSIFSSNLGLSYKLLLLIFTVFLIAAVLFVSIFNPLFDGLQKALELEGLSLSFYDIIQDPINNIQGIWRTATDYLSSNTMLIVSRFVFLCLLIIFARFFGSLALVPATKMLYNKMTAGYSDGLFASFVAALPQTLLFALVSSIIFSVIDLSLFFLITMAFFWLYKIFKVTALFIALGLLLAAYSARVSLFSQWLPLIVDGNKNVFKALPAAVRLSLRRFKTHYPMSLTINIFYAAIILTCTITTFGVLPIVTLPMYISMMCICALTTYFNAKNRKYYTDNGFNVYTPKKLDQ